LITERFVFTLILITKCIGTLVIIIIIIIIIIIMIIIIIIMIIKLDCCYRKR